MKKLVIILLLLCYQFSFSQFPSPTNFVFSSSYLPLGETGECNGAGVVGPYYCDHFEWEAPDTTTTSAILEYYNIYTSDLDFNNEMIIATTTETIYEAGLGIIGHLWITAVYSNPEGESLASNVQTNSDLPITVDDLNLKSKTNVYYNQVTQQIILSNYLNIEQLKIFDFNGRNIKTFNENKLEFSVSDLKKGIYYIEIKMSKKIIKRKLFLY